MKRKILKISLVGKTNAGKSTLLNNLVGEKISITNKKINTTEDFVIGIVNINKINSKGSSIREAERSAAEIALKKINEKKNIKN